MYIDKRLFTVIHCASMYWIFYIFLQLFVWNSQIREFFVRSHPVFHMGAGALSDVIWLPLSIALPIYLIILIRNIFAQLILREGISFIIVIVCAASIININFWFRIQFLLICLFVLFWAIHIYTSGRISLRFLFFSFAILGMILHYKAQLLPPLARTEPHKLSVMSFNFNTRSAYDDERTIQFIRYRIPDVVFLQELTMKEQAFILTRLGDFYPYFLSPAPRMGKNDVMILSRKKILYGDQIPLATTYDTPLHAVNHAVIQLEGQQVHLLNCHLHHAYKQLSAYLAAPDSLVLYEALLRAYNQQQEEASLLFEYASTLSGPIIIAGDFNDTPNGSIYALFNKKYQNAFAVAGWGLGTTFGEWSIQSVLPHFMRGIAFDIFRIDHLFFSNDFNIQRARVEKIAAFDHQPQIVQVTLEKGVTKP
ncbi:hypothetical protein EH223_19355 [candidate division KSB1 bacterium]|nr:endonuclease/exonuclease/phosphatase family protein [candidate division KSB1 bacterium]RQW00105.1 MAG: hypothetical protein EH223_19355 [candidate division KSB1 bacterium]